MGTQTYRSGHATYYLVVSLVSQNQAGNYSTLNVHLYAQADSGWSGNASGIGFSATAYGNGSFSFNGSSIDIVNYNFNVGHDANGYGSYSVGSHTNATGTSTFAGPTDMIDSGGLPRIPKVPGVPNLTVSPPAGRNVTLNVGIPGGYDEGGSSVTYLGTQYSKDGGAWSAVVTGGWGARTYTNLAPGSYVFRAFAHNAIGNSGYRVAAAVRVISGGKRNDATAGWVDLSIMRRFSGTAWIDISAAKKAVPDGANPMTWPELVGT